MNRTWRKIWTASWLMVLLLGAWATEAAPAVSVAKHCLWRTQAGTNTLYLLGAIHVLKPEDYPLAPVIESAFSNSAIAVFETDLGSLEQPKAQQELLAKGSLPEGETLQNQLAPGLYTNFCQHLADAGYPVEPFERLKPAMAAMTLEVLALQKLGYDFEYGVDRHFYLAAKRDGKTIVPLESVEFQVDLITEMPPAEGTALLKATLADIDQTRSEAATMLRAWKTGDAAGLEKLLNYGMRDSPELAKRMVTDRNRRWMPKLDALLHGGKTAIVIVGAGHLVGPQGLVALMQAKGYRLVQE